MRIYDVLTLSVNKVSTLTLLWSQICPINFPSLQQSWDIRTHNFTSWFRKPITYLKRFAFLGVVKKGSWFSKYMENGNKNGSITQEVASLLMVFLPPKNHWSHCVFFDFEGQVLEGWGPQKLNIDFLEFSRAKFYQNSDHIIIQVILSILNSRDLVIPIYYSFWKWKCPVSGRFQNTHCT